MSRQTSADETDRRGPRNVARVRRTKRKLFARTVGRGLRIARAAVHMGGTATTSGGGGGFSSKIMGLKVRDATRRETRRDSSTMGDLVMRSRRRP